MDTKIKHEKRYRRHRRVRAKISGTAKIPRLCVFRSNKHIYGQLIDDEKGKTLIAESDLKLNKRTKEQKNKRTKIKITADKPILITQPPLKGKVAIAYEVGRLIAQKALEKKIVKVAFDRGGYKYHGRVKALAQGAREEGLVF